MSAIRNARPEDAIEIAAVHVRAWQVAYRGLLPDAFLDGLSVAERAGRYTLGSSDPQAPRTILAVERDAVVGFATIGRCRDEDADDAAELYALYVDPPSWRSGVGRTLLEEVHPLLRATRFERAVLWVLVHNEAAERFYRADGWVPDGARREEDVWGVEAEVVRYQQSLRPRGN